MKIKKDKFLRARGGNTRSLEISCSGCGQFLLLYQKDGIGYLHRCYLNRIASPPILNALQSDAKITKPSEMPKLVCGCGKTVGIPMQHSDGRLAFRLERGAYTQRRVDLKKGQHGTKGSKDS